MNFWIIPNRGDIVEGNPKVVLKNKPWVIPLFGPYKSEEEAIEKFPDLMNRYCINKKVRDKWNLLTKS